MRTFILGLIMSVFSFGVDAQSFIENVKKKATEKKALILLNFSGSDWCIPCIKLHKNIIENDKS